MKTIRLTDDLTYRIAWVRHVADQGGDLAAAKGELADAAIAAVERPGRIRRLSKLADVKPKPAMAGIVDVRLTRKRA